MTKLLVQLQLCFDIALLPEFRNAHLTKHSGTSLGLSNCAYRTCLHRDCMSGGSSPYSPLYRPTTLSPFFSHVLVVGNLKWLPGNCTELKQISLICLVICKMCTQTLDECESTKQDTSELRIIKEIAHFYLMKKTTLPSDKCDSTKYYMNELFMIEEIDPQNARNQRNRHRPRTLVDCDQVIMTIVMIRWSFRDCPVIFNDLVKLFWWSFVLDPSLHKRPAWNWSVVEIPGPFRWPNW